MATKTISVKVSADAVWGFPRQEREVGAIFIVMPVKI